MTPHVWIQQFVKSSSSKRIFFNMQHIYVCTRCGSVSSNKSLRYPLRYNRYVSYIVDEDCDMEIIKQVHQS